LFEDIESKVRELAEYLDEEAIASALKLTPEAVRDILEGKANITKINTPNTSAEAPVIKVSSVKTAYRQKIISVCRAKGGVGCTVFALGLAYAISKEIRTLLIDLNFAEGGSDLPFYLCLTDYPNLGVAGIEPKNMAIRVDSGFYVIQPPRHMPEKMIDVEHLIYSARQDFDAIVIDLPNEQSELVHKAISLSNTIMAITSGLDQEIVRLMHLLSRYQHKDIFYIANQYKITGNASDLLRDSIIINIERDHTLQSTLEKCDLPKDKSIFMRGIKQVTNQLYEPEKKGIFSALLRR